MSNKSKNGFIKLFSLKSIRGKFFISIMVAFLGLGLILISYYTYQNTSLEIEDNIKLLKESKIDFLNLHRYQYDYIISNDINYVEASNKSYSALMSDLKGIRDNNLEHQKKLTSLINHIEEFNKTFQEYVNETKIIGLDNNTGLRGDLSNAGQNLEDEGIRLDNSGLIKDLFMIRRNEKDFQINKDEKYASEYLNSVELFLGKLSAQNMSQSDKTKLNNLTDKYKSIFSSLVDAYKKIGFTKNDGIQGKLNQISDLSLPEFEQFLKDYESKEYKKIFIISIVLYSSIGFLFFFIFLIYINVNKDILNPIDKVCQKMEILAEGIQETQGDLTQRIKVKKEDEIGRLITDYNYLLDVIQESFKRIKTATSEIVGASEEVTLGSSDLAGRSNEQAASVTQTSTTLDELSGIIDAGSESIAGITTDLDNFNREVEGKSAHIENVTETMREIDASGKKIDNIVNVINDISFQTNLLALNAAVEAARAGEAGRGFAVVASEVRNLAQKTAESSKTIQEIVTKNVESTKKGMVLVKETADFFSSIVENIGDILNRLKENSLGLQEQSTGVKQINEVVNQMDSVVNQNAQLSVELNANSTRIKANSMGLEEIIEKFKVDESESNISLTSASSKFDSTPSSKPSSPQPPKDKPKKPAEKSDKIEGKKPDSISKSSTLKTSDSSVEDDFFQMDDEDGFEEF